MKKAYLVLSVILYLLIFSNVVYSSENIVKNASFEEETGGKPSFWQTGSWSVDSSATEFKYESGVAHSGSKYITIINNLDNDSRYKIEVNVKENSIYKLSCWIKTENIGTKSKGASISVDGRLETSKDLKGSNAKWEYAEIYAKTGAGINTFNVSLGLGGYSSLNTGKASFDDVLVEEVTSMPEGAVAVNLVSDKKTSVQNSSDSNIKSDTKSYIQPIKGPGKIVYILLLLIAVIIILIVIYYYYMKRKNSGTNINIETKKDFHIDILDGLRGIAIILVLWFHIWQITWQSLNFTIFGYVVKIDAIPVTGFLGVDLFFFISGFCLFYPYARHLIEGARFQTLKQYINKRAIKIVPSYIFAIVMVLIFDKLLISTNYNFNNVKEVVWDFFTHSLFIHNWYYKTQGTFIGVFWSLGVEVQFYIIFPLVCWVFRKRPLLMYSLLSIVAICYRFYISNNHQNHLPFLLNQLPGFLDIFAGGMLGAYLLVLMRNKLENIEKLKPLFTLLALVVFVLMFQMLVWLYDVRFMKNGMYIWQINNRFFLSIIFLVLTITSAFSISFWKKTLANKVLVFLSVISYNLYIWHQLVALELFGRKVPIPQLKDPHNDSIWQIKYTIIAIISGVIFATIITFFFEKPILKNGIKVLFVRGANGFKKQQSSKLNL